MRSFQFGTSPDGGPVHRVCAPPWPRRHIRCGWCLQSRHADIPPWVREQRHHPTAPQSGLTLVCVWSSTNKSGQKKKCEEREVVGRRAGRLPMRKETVWNAGMHSHPECLNQLPVNAAEEQKTRISRTRLLRGHPPGKRNRTNFIMEDAHIQW